MRVVQGPRTLRPWYLHDTLTSTQRRATETRLQREPGAPAELTVWQMQPPSPVLWQRLMTQVQDSRDCRQEPLPPHLTLATVPAMAVLVLLWATLRPGISLEWRVVRWPALECAVPPGQR